MPIAHNTTLAAPSVEILAIHPKRMPQTMVAKKPVATHPDMCIESLPRKPHILTFDNALLALKLAPAARGQGAVLDGWTDPIGAHDHKVIEVEQAMLQEKELVGHAVVGKQVVQLGAWGRYLDREGNNKYDTRQPIAGSALQLTQV